MSIVRARLDEANDSIAGRYTLGHRAKEVAARKEKKGGFQSEERLDVSVPVLDSLTAGFNCHLIYRGRTKFDRNCKKWLSHSTQ